MKICLISVEIFAWGKYGGFGKATRIIGRELVKRGVEVCAVVPKRKGQKSIENLDGMTVFGFNPYNPLSAVKWFNRCDADIYHSCEPSFGTFLAYKQKPQKKHMVTCRDPRDFNDWKMELSLPSLNRMQVILNYLYENNVCVKSAMKRMDRICTTAKYLIPKVQSIYALKLPPKFLPTPVDIPKKIKKSKTPTVCYIARFDRRKRPEIYFEMAKKFPRVNFIAVGKSRDLKWDSYLREKYSCLPNLDMTGFIDQFKSNQLSEILGKSWVFVNTATREGLANSFLEAAAHKCAILSSVNPDRISSDFGYCAEDGDYNKGLEILLKNDAWRLLGEKGSDFVNTYFEMNKAVDFHVIEYESLLDRR